MTFFIFFSCKKEEVLIQLPKNSIEKKTEIVPEATARIIAQSFNPTTYYKLTNPLNYSSFHPNLTGNNQIESEKTLYDEENIPAIYVYNFHGNNGFLFVSADYQMGPILGYVENGKFDRDKAPAGFTLWLNKTIDNFGIIRKGLYDNSLKAHAAWNNYVQSEKSNNSTLEVASPLVQLPPPPPNPCLANPNYRTYTTVTYGPLLPVAWGQNVTYNNLCPDLGCANTGDVNAPTGCAATAIAMVIRYWQQPAGKYNYAAMPVNYGDINVQHLMVDAGSSLSMQYNCSGSSIGEKIFGGVLLSTSCAQQIANAFKSSYFNYSSATSKIYGGDGTTVNTNISYGWPVIFSGYPGWNSTLGVPIGDGHIWVCDGSSETITDFCMNEVEYMYTTQNLHMNWGWQEYQQQGNYNGWFGFNDFYISQTLTNWGNFVEITYNIRP